MAYENPAPLYQISITRTVANPDYNASPYRRDERPPLLEHTVTTATLTREQWIAVQRAIVEAIT